MANEWSFGLCIFLVTIIVVALVISSDMKRCESSGSYHCLVCRILDRLTQTGGS